MSFEELLFGSRVSTGVKCNKVAQWLKNQKNNSVSQINYALRNVAAQCIENEHNFNRNFNSIRIFMTFLQTFSIQLESISTES